MLSFTFKKLEISVGFFWFAEDGLFKETDDYWVINIPGVSVFKRK